MANLVPPGIAGLLGFGQTSWRERLRESAYNAPDGTRIKFQYEDVSREFELRGTAFQFPGINNAFIQRTGFGPRRYPMRIFFAGTDHDLVATAFEDALLQDGVGKLEHPMYGTVNVVPFGDVTRRDDLKTGANQTIIEFVFWTTTGVVYPRRQDNAESEIESAIAGFDVVAAQQFNDSTNLLDTVRKTSAKATFNKFLRDVSATLSGASDSIASVRREFQDIQDSINFGIDVLIGQPLLLAQQVSNLIKAPARAAAGIQSRLDGYANLATRIFGSDQGSPGNILASGVGIPLRTSQVANNFHISDLFALNAVSGSVVSVLENEFSTKPEAIGAAAQLLDQLEAAEQWRDAGFSDLGTVPELGPFQVDTGASYQALKQSVSLAAGFLVQISFELIQERRIVLDRPRSIVELCFELYGEVDAKLDFLVSSNDLTGSEILELPRGAVIKYYPEAT